MTGFSLYITLGNNFLRVIAIYFFAFFSVIASYAQENTNIQVKVYDQELIAIPNLEIKVADSDLFTTNSKGIGFISLPESSLPPSLVVVSHQTLEVESWNYSKGILEIIIRKKSYRQLIIKVLDSKSRSGLPGLQVMLVANDSIIILISDDKGIISFALPVSQSLENPSAFSVDGFQIVSSVLKADGGVLIIEKNEPPPDTQTLVLKPTIKQQKADINTDLELEDLDSITSITVLYSLMKKLNYNELDTDSKNKLDVKFSELLSQDLPSAITRKNAFELISDSSLINNDITVIVEKMKAEEEIMNNSMEEFEEINNQVRAKLDDGGQNLSIEDRKILFNQVLALRELLSKNEELFYKNNIYYRKQVDVLLNQIANIQELEDMLAKSELKSSELKGKFVFAFMALLVVSIITVLLVYLLKIFRSQKNELTKANEEISNMNANLETLVAEKTESLKLSNYELDTFLYRSSHNLKGPLTTIQGLANIGNLTQNPEANMLFDKIVDTTYGMEKMLSKLTMMNQVNRATNFSEIDLNKLVEKLKTDYSKIIERRNISFTTNIPKNSTFHSYSEVVELLLNNCLENAFYFCQLSKYDELKVDLTIQKDDYESLYITLRDNGCGIKPEVLDKIWGMFFLGTEISKGNGLGLYMVKKAVESLKGNISVSTEINEYFEISVTLPLIEPSINV